VREGVESETVLFEFCEVEGHGFVLNNIQIQIGIHTEVHLLPQRDSCDSYPITHQQRGVHLLSETEILVPPLPSAVCCLLHTVCVCATGYCIPMHPTVFTAYSTLNDGMLYAVLHPIKRTS
jgi:hypothetical protein